MRTSASRMFMRSGELSNIVLSGQAQRAAAQRRRRAHTVVVFSGRSVAEAENSFRAEEPRISYLQVAYGL
eukprot:1178933-Prymnesium_polylepis.2